jgi:hypothetical protein
MHTGRMVYIEEAIVVFLLLSLHVDGWLEGGVFEKSLSDRNRVPHFYKDSVPSKETTKLEFPKGPLHRNPRALVDNQPELERRVTLN